MSVEAVWDRVKIEFVTFPRAFPEVVYGLATIVFWENLLRLPCFSLARVGKVLPPHLVQFATWFVKNVKISPTTNFFYQWWTNRNCK